MDILHNMEYRNKTISIAWLAWLLASLFYGYEFVLRVAPHTMTTELMADFSIDNASLGHLAGCYFYAYGIALIPAGLLLDRMNFSVVLFVSAIIVSFGSFALGNTTDIYVAYASRAIIGAGSAFAFLGCLKIASQWLPSKKFPFIVGLTDLFGKIGGIIAGAPLAVLVTKYGWRDANYILSWVGLIISALLIVNIYVHLKQLACENKAFEAGPVVKEPKETLSQILSRLFLIMSSRQTWVLAIYGGLLVAPIAGYLELWGTPFLVSAYGISKQDAASVNSVIYLGIAVGGSSIGYLATIIPNYKKIMFYCTTTALVCFVAVIYGNLPLKVLIVLLFIYGACTSNMLLCFTLTKIIHSKDVSALAIGFTNTIIMAFGALSQPAIGKILDYAEKESFITATYNVEKFQLAFIILPICLIIALPLIPLFKTSIIEEE